MHRSNETFNCVHYYEFQKGQQRSTYAQRQGIRRSGGGGGGGSGSGSSGGGGEVDDELDVGVINGDQAPSTSSAAAAAAAAAEDVVVGAMQVPETSFEYYSDGILAVSFLIIAILAVQR